MKMLNRVVLEGRMVRDAEMRRTEAGTPVASFALAVERGIKNRGDDMDKTDFINCVAWDTTAEFLSKYFPKGKLVLVEGSLQSRKWQDREGRDRISWEVVVRNVWFTGDSGKSASKADTSIQEAEDDGQLPF